jgi:hypothetical protein
VLLCSSLFSFFSPLPQLSFLLGSSKLGGAGLEQGTAVGMAAAKEHGGGGGVGGLDARRHLVVRRRRRCRLEIVRRLDR